MGLLDARESLGLSLNQLEGVDWTRLNQSFWTELNWIRLNHCCQGRGLMAARGPSLIVTGGCSQWMGWLWDGQSPWCFLCSLIPAYFKNHTLIAVYIPGLGTGDSKLNQIEAFWVKSSGSRRNWHMGKQRKRPTGQKGVVDTRALCWDGFGVGVGGRKWSPPGWVKKAIPSSTGDSVLPQLRGRKMCDDSCVCVCVQEPSQKPQSLQAWVKERDWRI